MKELNISEMSKAVMSLKKVYIIPHVNPDGDALGSSFGLCRFLRENGRAADVVLEKEIPQAYAFLNGDYILTENASEKRDVIVLDCGDLSRTGKSEALFNAAEHTLVIDHHETNEGYGEKCTVMGEMSSTCEMIFNLIKAAKLKISRDVAFALYTGITSDTGGMRYSCTSPATLRAAAELLETGLDIAYINRMVFENNSLKKIRLKGMVYDSLRILADGKAAIVRMTKEMLEKAGANEDDSEGFVNIPRSVEGVEIGIFLKEREDEIRVSLRSNSYADVSKIAKALGGGGHFHAGGCSYKGSLDETEEKVLSLIKEQIFDVI